MIKILTIMFFGLIISFGPKGSELKIEAYQAPSYIGETVIACGNIAQVSEGQKALYLNLDSRYPNQSLTFLVWNNNLKDYNFNLGKLTRLKNRRVCASGEIIEYKGSLQIHVSTPLSLLLVK